MTIHDLSSINHLVPQIKALCCAPDCDAEATWANQGTCCRYTTLYCDEHHEKREYADRFRPCFCANCGTEFETAADFSTWVDLDALEHWR